MNFISLFAGIGGMDLGFERAGLKCVAQVENDPYCLKVLTKHWPEVPKYGDIEFVRGGELPDCDILAGGFPCQDLSWMGDGAGLDGDRSGLWKQFYRLVCEIRPYYVVIENVAALLKRGLSRVLSDLAAIGYHAEWRVLRGWDFGLAHLRRRLFVIAYTIEKRRQRWSRWLTPKAWAFGAERRPIKGLSETAFWRDLPKPVISGSGNGVPDRVGRSNGAGNAIPPAYSEYIAQCLLNHARIQA